jgi:magnesium-transporting ATPase (P-type)
MQKMLESIKAGIKRANERDKKLERPIEKVSRTMWPWRESKLILFVGLLAVSDYISTFMALRLSANHQISELGLLAKWALSLGGFAQLFLVDATAIGLLILLAFGVRALYNQFGFPGFACAAFIFIFVPYAVIIVPVVINNVFLTFR